MTKALTTNAVAIAPHQGSTACPGCTEKDLQLHFLDLRLQRAGALITAYAGSRAPHLSGWRAYEMDIEKERLSRALDAVRAEFGAKAMMIGELAGAAAQLVAAVKAGDATAAVHHMELVVAKATDPAFTAALAAPIATFEGYLDDGTPSIKWTGAHRPAAGSPLFCFAQTTEGLLP